ncbi:MAG: hypothetical protein RIQ64_1444 [Actinomycetota bacterium]
MCDRRCEPFARGTSTCCGARECPLQLTADSDGFARSDQTHHFELFDGPVDDWSAVRQYGTEGTIGREVAGDVVTVADSLGYEDKRCTPYRI